MFITQGVKTNMKAPDKIYIDDLAVVNDCTTKNSTKPLPNFSEYIRKDSLMEWAKEKDLSSVLHHPDRHYILIELIDKLNSI